MEKLINLKNAKVLSRDHLKLIFGRGDESVNPVISDSVSNIAKCVAKYKCYDKPTNAGVMLCVGDCISDPAG